MVNKTDNMMKFPILFTTMAYVITGLSVNVAAGTSLTSQGKGMPGIDLPDTTSISSVIITPIILDIVPPSSGVQVFNDGIIFLAHSTAEEKIPENHLSFGTLRTYMAISNDSVLQNLEPFELTTPMVFPSEATTFNDDFSTMYVSLIPAGGNSEKIFRASKGQKGWEIDRLPLTFCTNDNIYTHPSLSSDGKLMVFSSDITGSMGGLDLYVSMRDGDNWSSPENLGKQINSAGNELFACLDRDNNLYFSSDGLPGAGGYDVYISIFNGKGWEKPVNLPGVINTPDDEVAFIVSRSNNQTAYFSERKTTGKRRTRLYKVSNPSTRSLAMFLGLDKGQGSNVTVYSDPIAEITVMAETKAEELVTSGVQEAKVAETTAQATVTNSQEASPKEPLVIAVNEKSDDVVVYRVQILANVKSLGNYAITVAGTKYNSFEYLYKGAYRTTIGEYSTMAEAVRLQNVCRQNGYSQAFVVAFKNNIRTNDPALFR